MLQTKSQSSEKIIQRLNQPSKSSTMPSTYSLSVEIHNIKEFVSQALQEHKELLEEILKHVKELKSHKVTKGKQDWALSLRAVVAQQFAESPIMFLKSVNGTYESLINAAKDTMERNGLDWTNSKPQDFVSDPKVKHKIDGIYNSIRSEYLKKVTLLVRTKVGILPEDSEQAKKMTPVQMTEASSLDPKDPESWREEWCKKLGDRTHGEIVNEVLETLNSNDPTDETGELRRFVAVRAVYRYDFQGKSRTEAISWFNTYCSEKWQNLKDSLYSDEWLNKTGVESQDLDLNRIRLLAKNGGKRKTVMKVLNARKIKVVNSKDSEDDVSVTTEKKNPNLNFHFKTIVNTFFKAVKTSFETIQKT